MEQFLNYKAFNIELLEPYLQEMRRGSTQSKTNSQITQNKKRGTVHS